MILYRWGVAQMRCQNSRTLCTNLGPVLDSLLIKDQGAIDHVLGLCGRCCYVLVRVVVCCCCMLLYVRVKGL
jgi:hypothetical protein